MLQVNFRFRAIWVCEEFVGRGYDFAGEESRDILFGEIPYLKESGECICPQVHSLL